MFPPTGYEIWNKNLLWQPIAVHSIPERLDYLISAYDICPRYLMVRDQYEASPEVRTLIDGNRELFEYLGNHAGQPVSTFQDLLDIREALDIESRRNLA